MLEAEKETEGVMPEFKPEYYWAFVTLMLYKLGGTEAISQKQIEKFDTPDYPAVMYDHDKKAWIMKLLGVEPPAIVPVLKKQLIKTPKIFRS